MFNFFKKKPAPIPEKKPAPIPEKKPAPIYKITLDSVWYVTQDGTLVTVSSQDFGEYKDACDALTLGVYPENTPQEPPENQQAVAELSQIGIDCDKYTSSSNPTDALAALQAFAAKLNQNPSFKSRRQAAGFINANNIPILKNGNLLAFKAVRPDYFDKYTGKTFEYKVGSTHLEQRHNINDDSGIACSKGLHAGGPDYVSSFGHGADRFIGVEINPRDMVSVPRDSQQGKMRVCELTVVCEYETKEDMYTASKHLRASVSDNEVTYDIEFNDGKVSVSKRDIASYVDTLDGANYDGKPNTFAS